MVDSMGLLSEGHHNQEPNMARIRELSSSVDQYIRRHIHGGWYKKGGSGLSSVISS